MKRLLILFLILPGLVLAGEDEHKHGEKDHDHEHETEPAPANNANFIGLDEAAVRNLGIETEVVMEMDFEETIFALGRIEAVPSKLGVLSSRIAGRIVELLAHEGDTVAAGQELVKVESRQPGNPPPVIALTAPIGGLVTESHVRLGEPVEPEKEMLDITDLSEVYAIARVPEDQAGELKEGIKAHIRVAAIPGETFTGELLRFGTSADRESSTIDAIFRLQNKTGKLRPDMRAEFSIILSTRPNVMAVPRAALQGDPASRVVYVKHLDIPNAFEKAPVQIGAKNDRYVEILSGVFLGDDVVVKGAYSLAFAGAGSISLKEALDAAHGHAHNEDGSEMTAAQQAAAAKGKGGDGSGGGASLPLVIFLAAGNVLLLILLIVSNLRRKPQLA